MSCERLFCKSGFRFFIRSGSEPNIIFARMLKRYFLLISVAVLALSTLESCFIFRPKNKCDSCPGIIKHKKAKKSSKGSI
jgi:hypothetical protein